MRIGIGVVTALSLAVGWAQSPADPINGRLPGWLQLQGEYRIRAEGVTNRGFADGQGDGYLLHRIRIGVRLQPTDWLQFVAEGQDSRIFLNDKVPSTPPNEGPMDLRVGYVQLGDPASSHISVRAGRQDLIFGEQRLVGNTPWSNLGRSFDAIRVTLRDGGYRLDAFASSVVVPNLSGFDRPQAGNNLHGLYGHAEKLVPHGVIEPYVLWRLAPRQAAENASIANLDFKTVGMRWAGSIPGGIDYSTEMAMQRGSLGPDRMRAWAGHWMGGYTIAGPDWKPRISAEYNFASGDADPHDGVRGTFDSLYPTSHGKYGLCDQVGWRNIRDLRFGVDGKPSSKFSVSVNYHDWWLANARDGLYNSGGTLIVRNAAGTAGTHVGQETDLDASYAFSKEMRFGAGVGHIFPGQFLKQTTTGRGYTYPFVVADYTF
ncbi:MAG TPA: alginate export family protein [Bryobacteraceae bacterium]|nr:alginate export family protein [Bryobacteraceae bacterium]